jgi:hypothetical protein
VERQHDARADAVMAAVIQLHSDSDSHDQQSSTTNHACDQRHFRHLIDLIFWLIKVILSKCHAWFQRVHNYGSKTYLGHNY